MDRYLKNILSTPEQFCFNGLVNENLFVLRGARPDGIIICGMGGSGLAGMILSRSQKEVGLELPVFIWKDYGLPPAARYGLKHPLYVFISFSGDTEETVSGFRDAVKKRGASVAAVTTGGKLFKLAEQHHAPLVSFPAGDLTPRQGVGRMFYALIQILQAARLIPQKQFDYRHLGARREQAEGKRLAGKIFKKTTVIYTDSPNDDLAYLWKISINETGKQMAFANTLPEPHHNEINGFQRAGKGTAALMLLPEKNSPAMKKRFLITGTLLKKSGVRAERVALGGRNRLETAWRTLMLTEWTGYYLAKMHKTDPASTPAVDAIKRFLRN